MVQSDARIRCIAPESIARYFDQPIWVMGFGEWSWSKPKKAGYLSVEQLGQSDIDNHCRRAFGHWALTHPKLLGVSYAGTIDGKQNFPLEGMPVISKPVQLIKKPTTSSALSSRHSESHNRFKEFAIQVAALSKVPVFILFASCSWH